MRLGYERRVVLTALVALAPLVVIALIVALDGNVTPKVRWTIGFFIIVAIFVCTYVLHEVLTYPLRTLSNLITALREEDYSLRARNPRRDDVLGEVLYELNLLTDLMESRKLEAVEATALLRAVMAEMDAAIFAFDAQSRLQFVNPAGERLLNAPAERITGRSADDVGLADLLTSDAAETVDRRFPGGAGRWNVRRSTFREKGVPHRLLVVADISRALREEEAEAWRRIVRVLGHELNNSLAPIKSIATSMERLVTREPLPGDWRDDVRSGMRVVGSRAEALTRFTRAYAQLARLPEPRPRAFALGDLVRRVAALETRIGIHLAGPEINIVADEDQIEQLLINVLKNAADASLESGGRIAVRWREERGAVLVQVLDEGPGLSGSANLFVPFFTTKPNGTGIGLVLSRQIAEAHGGTLTLENRGDRAGCVATLTLPEAVSSRAEEVTRRDEAL